MNPSDRVSVQGCLQSEWLKDLYSATVQSHIKKIREIRKTKAVSQGIIVDNDDSKMDPSLALKLEDDTSAEEEELDHCKELFDLSGEFEAKINTLFGVRHLMYEELINFHRNRHKKFNYKHKRKSRQ